MFLILCIFCVLLAFLLALSLLAAFSSVHRCGSWSGFYWVLIDSCIVIGGADAPPSLMDFCEFSAVSKILWHWLSFHRLIWSTQTSLSWCLCVCRGRRAAAQTGRRTQTSLQTTSLPKARRAWRGVAARGWPAPRCASARAHKVHKACPRSCIP